MDTITKGVGELSTEDSGSSQDKADEPSLGDSQTSTEAVGDALGDAPAKYDIPNSGVELAPPSPSKNSITTRSSKKVSEQRKTNPFSMSRSSSSAVTDVTDDPSAGFSVGGHSISTRSCRRKVGALNKHNQTMKFMENFDPEHSNRERKKLTRQITSSGKRKPTLYDEKGVLIGAEVDLCDCLDEGCPGCHFPCPKCHSNKCGHECRQNRRWTYEEIWVEGTSRIVTNPLLGVK